MQERYSQNANVGGGGEKQEYEAQGTNVKMGSRDGRVRGKAGSQITKSAIYWSTSGNMIKELVVSNAARG